MSPCPSSRLSASYRVPGASRARRTARCPWSARSRARPVGQAGQDQRGRARVAAEPAQGPGAPRAGSSSMVRSSPGYGLRGSVPDIAGRSIGIRNLRGRTAPGRAPAAPRKDRGNESRSRHTQASITKCAMTAPRNAAVQRAGRPGGPPAARTRPPARRRRPARYCPGRPADGQPCCPAATGIRAAGGHQADQQHVLQAMRDRHPGHRRIRRAEDEGRAA